MICTLAGQRAIMFDVPPFFDKKDDSSVSDKMIRGKMCLKRYPDFPQEGHDSASLGVEQTDESPGLLGVIHKR